MAVPGTQKVMTEVCRAIYLFLGSFRIPPFSSSCSFFFCCLSSSLLLKWELVRFDDSPTLKYRGILELIPSSILGEVVDPVEECLLQVAV